MPELTKPRTLLTGLAMGESPRWHEHHLWFSDWGTGEIISTDLEGRSQVEVHGLSLPFCFDWLPDGSLVVVSGREARLLRREAAGTFTSHADLSGLSTHPWNDIVVDGRGNIYVNSIGFDFPSGEFAPGIVALVTADGTVRQVAEGAAFPNGMVVTPDNSTLILAESYGSRLTAFDIAPDGTLSNRRVWAELHGGAPDGICLDAENAVWYADVPNTRCVRVRAGGEVLQTVTLDRGCFACMLGGADRKTLFVVAAEWRGTTGTAGGARQGQLVAVEAPAPGAGWP